VDDDKFKADLATLTAEADELKDEFTRLNESAKATKKLWEAAIERILVVCRQAKEEHPLFDGRDEVTATFKAGDGEVIDADYTLAQIEGPAAEANTSSSDDSWKAIEVSELVRHGLSDGVITKLYDAGMSTIGAIANWSQSGKQLTDLPGIGQSKAGEIGDALESFWHAWRHKQTKKSA
jgi:hypothetical protein